MKTASSRNGNRKKSAIPRAFLPLITLMLMFALTVLGLTFTNALSVSWGAVFIIGCGAFLCSTILVQQFKGEFIETYRRWVEKEKAPAKKMA